MVCCKMLGTIYLHLLIFFGIWYQGIIETFADEEIKESSDFLVRQKRVVYSHEQREARVVRIEERAYVVYIKKGIHIQCVGTILSHSVVITSAECAQSHPTEYKVYSKSSVIYHGTRHNVTNIKILLGNIPHRYLDGIALFTIDPAIEYGLFVNKIGLHVEPVLPGILGFVTGWGYYYKNKVIGPGTKYPTSLRTIEVPIIPHRNCENIYRNYYPITEKDICTFHSQRHAGHTDGGAPLVIDDTLVGVFLRSGPLGFPYNPQYPEVFALLQNAEYSVWIRNNTGTAIP